MACQNCNGCNTCNGSCNSCNTCQGSYCLSCQSFCQVGKEVVSSRAGAFTWGEGITTESGDRFFSLDTWKKIFTYINNARTAGTYGKETTEISMENSEYMTAADFNTVSNALFGLGGNSETAVKKEVEVGDIIYGTYFSILASQANTLKYKSNQCDRCNTSCNNCVTCQTTCNTCQSGNTSSSCCETSGGGTATE